ncbi:MAG: DUF6079 family protein [Halanaerobiales bacterium]|nr:DUF6079 family protein [Halanaerobiales bacterium]
MKIKELVNVKDVRTVVQMADIKDPKLRDFLTESFVITEEVEKVMLSFFGDLVKNEGKGYFLEGNFGSGKSHLLSVISLLLNYRKSWQHILDQKDYSNRLEQLSKDVLNKNYITINLSLVEHSNKEYLEDIVMEEIMKFINENDELSSINFKGEEEFIEKISKIIKEEHQNMLKSFLRENGINESELFETGNLYLIEKLLERLNLPYRFSYNRQQIFDQITDIINNYEYDGLVILIDELSEFLRSKPDGRRFNEDIRFMQFLGEYAKRQPCWIMATLQEEIEKTGETTPEAFNKIKDRYPTRFYLTGQHIKELINKRLIEIKEGKTDKVQEIYQKFNTSFPALSFSEEDFVKLYPVHPTAIDLLDNLKPLFSQHRGIIDFIHYRLKGDPSRDIDSMMDSPAENLLTADKIFDHFVGRIREMMETNPYFTKVYKYYKQEIKSLLDQDDQKTGMKIIKLLILFSISPIDKKYTVEDITNMLFVKITDLDPSINYEYVEDILNRMYQHGAYLVKEKGEDQKKNKYYIDLEADVNLIIKRRIEYIKSNLFKNDKRIFTKLGKQVQEKFLPLNNLFANHRQKRTVTWQNTERKGFLYFLPVREISIENIKQTAERLTNDEEDFMLIMSYALDVNQDKKYLNDVLIPELGEEEKNSFAFWFPEELKEKEFLKNALAKIILLEKYETESSKTGEKVKKQLNSLIQEETDRISKIFRDAYFNGKVVNGFNESIVNLDELGFLPFQRFLNKIVATLLEERFPDHKKINPYQSVLTTDRMDAVLDKFISSGDIDNLKDLSGRVLGVIDAYMKPMGLIKKRKNGVRLTIEPSKNPLIKKVFHILEEEKTPLEEVYWTLRKGSYGLSREQFKLLIYSLLYSGYLTAYSANQKISLKNLNARNFNRIKYIGYGELISEEFQAVLSDCSLLPPRYQKRHFSLPLQQNIWKHLIEKKKELSDDLDRMTYQVERLKNDSNFETFNLKQISNYINKVKELLDEIMVSYSSEEGLERFASKYRNMPNIETYLTNIEKIKYFLENNINNYRNIVNYLNHPDLKIPEQDKYQEIRSFRNNLLLSLSDDSIIYDSDFFSEVKNKFSEFKQQYIDLYQKEHNKQKGNDRFKPILDIKKKKGYQILKYFSDIELISVKDDLVKVDRTISKALNKKCNQNTLNILQDRPVCDCGFQLGETIELPSKKEIQQTIDSGVKQYIKKLKIPEYKNKIEVYLDNMEAAGNKRFARPIRNLLNVKPDKNLYNNLSDILNRNVIKRINSVLSGNVSLVERSLDELYENLINRSFSLQQIKQIFKEWLEGSSGINNKTYVKVTGNLGEDTSPAEKENNINIITNYVKQKFPELETIINHTDINVFIKLFAVIVWRNSYQIEKGLEELITQIIPENSTVLIEELKQDVSLKNSLNEMNEQIFSSKEEFDLKKAFRKKIDELDLSKNLINIISPANIKEVLDAIETEPLSQKMINRLLVQFIKIVENIHLDLQEKENYIETVEKKLQNLNKNHLYEYKYNTYKLALHYFSLESSFSYLDSKDNINDLKEWKKVHTNYLSNLEFDYFKIDELSEKVNVQDIVPKSIKFKKVKQTIGNYQKLFTNFHDSRDIMGEDHEKFMGNNLVYLLKERYPSLMKKMNTKRGYCLLLDGMRWDLWKMIKQEINNQLSLRLIEEDSLLALTPTNTEKQIQTLKKSGLEINITNQNKVINDYQSLNNNTKQCNEIIKFSYIDDKVHSSKDDYNNFLKEIKFQTQNRLIPFLDKMPASTAVLIFSDHGFTINHNFNYNNKYEEPRYLHGGKSFHEIIVPWAFMYKP